MINRWTFMVDYDGDVVRMEDDMRVKEDQYVLASDHESALRKYGRHLEECAHYLKGLLFEEEEYPCTCGFNEALAHE